MNTHAAALIPLNSSAAAVFIFTISLEVLLKNGYNPCGKSSSVQND